MLSDLLDKRLTSVGWVEEREKKEKKKRGRKRNE